MRPAAARCCHLVGMQEQDGGDAALFVALASGAPAEGHIQTIPAYVG